MTRGTPESGGPAAPGAGRPPFPVDEAVFAVLEQLWSAGYAGYLVGGGVRDALLGLPVADWDIATDARPEQLLGIFAGSTYQNRFGTVLVGSHEVTTFRRDHRYADHRRPDSVTFSEDLSEDLARRDLTINAIAWGRRGPDGPLGIVDPADGQGDLRAGLVRAVGDPARRFDEDALRLLRAVRIAARLGFEIEPLTRKAMVAHAADLGWVSEERVGSEIRRMLEGERPSRAIGLLADIGLLAAALPELERLPAASLARTMAALDTAAAALDTAAAAHPGRARVLLAALLAEAGPEEARRCLLRLRVGAREAEAVAALVEAASVPYDGTWSDAGVRRYMSGVPAELLEDLLAIRGVRTANGQQAQEGELGQRAQEADLGQQAQEAELAARVRAQRDAGAPLTLAALAIDGDDLREALGLPEGPLVGDILERLLAAVIDDPAGNSRPALLARAGAMLEDQQVRREPPIRYARGRDRANPPS